MIEQCKEPTNVIEVGRGSFSMYQVVLSEERTRLGVWTYERLAMLAVMIKKKIMH